MIFEFDPAKSSSNKEKHGIDFEQAKLIWDDPDALEFDLITDDEQRSMVIGNIGNKLWSAIITYRNGHVRIISVRRARKVERTLYES